VFLVRYELNLYALCRRKQTASVVYWPEFLATDPDLMCDCRFRGVGSWYWCHSIVLVCVTVVSLNLKMTNAVNTDHRGTRGTICSLVGARILISEYGSIT
jgi:hypothetical protein